MIPAVHKKIWGSSNEFWRIQGPIQKVEGQPGGAIKNWRLKELIGERDGRAVDQFNNSSCSVKVLLVWSLSWSINNNIFNFGSIYKTIYGRAGRKQMKISDHSKSLETRCSLAHNEIEQLFNGRRQRRRIISLGHRGRCFWNCSITFSILSLSLSLSFTSFFIYIYFLHNWRWTRQWIL